VIGGGKITLSDNTRCVKDWLCAYFAIYREQIADSKLWQTQYLSSDEGQHITALPLHSWDRYSDHNPALAFERNLLCWLIDLALSVCKYVAMEKYKLWNCLQKPFTILTSIYGLQEAHQQKVFLSQWVFGSYWTRIPGWLKSRVDLADAVPFRCIWNQWWNIYTNIDGWVELRNWLAVPATTLEVPTTTLEEVTSCLEASTTSSEVLAACLTVLAYHMGVVATMLEALATSQGAQVTSLGAPEITGEHSGINHIIIGNAAGVHRNHSYCLPLNDIENRCIQFEFSSMYLYVYVSVYL